MLEISGGKRVIVVHKSGFWSATFRPCSVYMGQNDRKGFQFLRCTTGPVFLTVSGTGALTYIAYLHYSNITNLAEPCMFLTFKPELFRFVACDDEDKG